MELWFRHFLCVYDFDSFNHGVLSTTVLFITASFTPISVSMSRNFGWD